MMLEIDRRAFIASLGGAAAVSAMSHEARADALEDYSIRMLDEAVEQAQAARNGQAPQYPTAAEIDARIEGSRNRRGVGNLFVGGNQGVRRLEPMPKKPTLIDFFNLRFKTSGAYNHVLQSATRALKTGMSEQVILACLLHDVVQSLMKVDHGWWGGQLFDPYVPERTAFGIRYHQALRFYADEANGYAYPETYYRTFGVDYKPEPYIEETYQMVRKHKWYIDPRMVCVNDLYSFDSSAVVSMDPFVDIIGRHFKQPKEGLGFDNSPVAHMWRSIAFPDHPL